MDDLISRQAAIDFIDAGHLCNPNEPRWSDNEVVNFLKSRPSVQPNLQQTCNKLATDCISRQEALDKIREVYEYEFPTASGAFDEFVTVIIPNLLRNLFSAQPERKKGKWIIVTDSRGRHARCPYCGEWKYHSNQKFCGECGARMEVEK